MPFSSFFPSTLNFNALLDFRQSPGDFEQKHQEGPVEIPGTPGEINVTSYVSPATTINVDGGEDVAWVNPNNSQASDDAYAVATTGGEPFQTIQSLKCTNFSHSIPAGATILGVETRIERKGDFNNEQRDKDVKLVIGDSVVGTAATAIEYITTERVDTLGSSSDLWGNTITQAQAVAADFGVNIQAEVFSGGGGNIFSIDHVQMRIHYQT